MIIDVHSHAWRFPEKFGEDLIYQAQQARAGQPVDLRVTYAAYAATAPAEIQRSSLAERRGSAKGELMIIQSPIYVAAQPDDPPRQPHFARAGLNIVAAHGDVSLFLFIIIFI